MSRFPKSLQRNQPLKEQAYQALRKMILSGELTPGQRLVEAQLARDLQVSRTPIREALGQLQRESLVVANAEHGLQVATFSAEDAAQLYECRIALEQVSVIAACHNGSVTQLRKLHRLVQQSEKLARTKPSALLNFQLLELDYQFHRLIAEMSGNPWLQTMLDQVFDKMTLLRIQTIQQNQHVLDIRTEHLYIYDAIAERNAEAATVALTEHLKAAQARVVHELQILLLETKVT
ncbi:GntR family transcriptional regulator [Leptodesmis sichuanensis]|uniref:GntR family transcriptional regulator n=1 Tax=Leptodesmis sichuanensis TaxID=2906798 RepID=UPI001F32DD7D|nr:GntR family transcriptional regulator [Leptodesmis sichuanensis]UIE38123.1 GntR family transcriptional regulator [Leptodesmis sichuanensis A121]